MQANKNYFKKIAKKQLEFFIQKAGKAQLDEIQYQHVDIIKNSAQDADGDQFRLEQDVSMEEINSIKTAPFNTNINLGPADRPQISNQPPQLEILGVPFVFGFNQGTKTITLLEGKICRAVGTSIILQQKIYMKHNYQICTLHYDSQRQMLCSGSQGRNSEVIQWKVVKIQDKFILEFKTKSQYPLRSLAPNLSIYFKNFLISISKFSLQQTSSLFLFDQANNKRINSSLKIGKVITILATQPITLLNQTGIHELIVKQNSECEIKLILEKGFVSSCELAHQNIIFLGNFNGFIEIMYQGTIKDKTVKVHQGLVCCLKYQKEKKLLFSSGQWDQKIVISSFWQDTMSLNIVSNLQLQNVCREILFDKKLIYYPLRNGKIKIFQICENFQQTQKTEAQINMIFRQQGRQNVSSTFLYNQFNQKYIYSISNNFNMNVIQLNQETQIVDIKSIKLKQKPQLLTVCANLVAYTYFQKNTIPSNNNQSNRGSSIGLQNFVKSVTLSIFKFKNVQAKKQELYIQDYTDSQLINVVQVDSQKAVTCLSFNPTGDKLATGFQSGQISIYNCSKPKQIFKMCESSQSGKCHNKPISQLIWCSEGKQLTSISSDNLLFYEVVYSTTKKDYQLVLTRNVKETEWTQMGRFSWKTSKMWQRANTVDQIKDIKESYNSLFAVMSDGSMKAYRNPSGTGYQDLGYFFNGQYECSLIEKDSTNCLILRKQGILLCVQIKDKQLEDQ